MRVSGARAELGRRFGVYVGLLEVPGTSRSRLARVLTVGEDSSRTQALLGLALAVVVLALVVLRVLSGSVWFRPVAGFASVFLLANLARLVRQLARRQREGRW